MTESQELLEAIQHNRELIVVLSHYVIALCVMTAAQIAVNVVAVRRVYQMLTRVESLLAITEVHGCITDEKTKEIKRASANTAKAVVDIVRRTAAEMPGKLVEEMAKAKDSSPDTAFPSATTPTQT